MATVARPADTAGAAIPASLGRLGEGPDPDVEALGPFAERSLAWWGMVLAIVTEATLFALLLFAYVYLRVRADSWPLGGIKDPELVVTGLRSVLLLGSSVPVQLAEHAFLHGRRRAALRYLALAWVMAAVFLAGHIDEQVSSWKDFRPSTNAYGSLFYTITNLHAVHLVIGLSFVAFVFVRILQGGVRPGRHDALTVTVLYWHFVDVVWIAVFSCLYLSVSLWHAPAGSFEPVDAKREPRFSLLMFALTGGLVIWFVHLFATALPVACDHDLDWLLNLLTVVTAVAAAASIAAASWLVRCCVSSVGAHNGRTAMLSALGVLINVLSLMLIVLEGFPVLFIDPCRAA